MQSETQRKWIVFLLLLSCATAGTLLLTADPTPPKKLESGAELDSLIQTAFHELDLTSSQIRERTIPVDSVFSRKSYHIQVAPNFSKTTLHYILQEKIWPYGARTVARVEFPERDMHLHVLFNNLVHRSLIIQEDSDLLLQQNQPVVLPGQDSHEMD